ncbi:Uncharacterised protein [uncultured archaeon]|nr:Uncharacterised protein [uncultured archaeon]
MVANSVEVPPLVVEIVVDSVLHEVIGIILQGGIGREPWV